MNRPRLIRGLRIAWTAVFGVLCVLLVVLWVRSCWKMDSFSYEVSESTGAFIAVTPGMIQYYQGPLLQSGWTWKTEWTEDVYTRFNSGGAFNPKIRPHDFGEFGIRLGGFYFPIWFSVLMTGIAAMLAAPRPRSLSFSLRTLLIATTAVAVILGLVVYATR